MADLSVTVNGVKFKNPVIVGSATPTMDWRGTKKGIDGGCSGAIVKSLFGDAGKLGRSFPRPRFMLYDYKNYPRLSGKTAACLHAELAGRVLALRLRGVHEGRRQGEGNDRR